MIAGLHLFYTFYNSRNGAQIMTEATIAIESADAATLSAAAKATPGWWSKYVAKRVSEVIAWYDAAVPLDPQAQGVVRFDSQKQKDCCPLLAYGEDELGPDHEAPWPGWQPSPMSNEFCYLQHRDFSFEMWGPEILAELLKRERPLIVVFEDDTHHTAIGWRLGSIPA